MRNVILLVMVFGLLGASCGGDSGPDSGPCADFNERLCSKGAQCEGSSGEFTVSVEAANDPDATHPVAYVVEHDAGTFFHGGDTKPADSFPAVAERYDVDLGVLAFGTVGMVTDGETGESTRTKWYSDENQVIEAANALEIDRLLPSHWDMWKGLTADPTTLHHHAASFEYPRELEIAEIGDRVDLRDE